MREWLSLYRRSPGMAATEAEAERVPVFASEQALLAFPFASAIVTILWKVSGSLNAEWGESRFIALVISLIVGALIYLIGFSSALSPRRHVIAAAIALINAFLLDAATIGIDVSVLGNTPTP